MTLPKSPTLKKVASWIAPKLGAALLAVIGAGLIALASQWFVTHEAMAKDVTTPLSAEIAMNKEQADQIAALARVAATLEVEKRAASERLAAEKAANDERDKVIRSLVDTTRALADEVRVQADKTRGHEAQIVSLQAATAGVRTEIAVVQANQIAAAKQSDRIEDKLDRLIESKPKR